MGRCLTKTESRCFTIFTLNKMRRILLLILSLVALQTYAQFSYSVKAGWSFPFLCDVADEKKKTSPTFGVGVDYAINDYLGLQSGLNYKRICYVNTYEGMADADDLFTDKGHFIEMPLLLTANAISSPQSWRAIWNAGMYMDIPIKNNYNAKVYYGILAGIQIEIRSRYFVRGEYQWALSSDKKGEWNKKRRINMLTFSFGYKF